MYILLPIEISVSYMCEVKIVYMLTADILYILTCKIYRTKLAL